MKFRPTVLLPIILLASSAQADEEAAPPQFVEVPPPPPVNIDPQAGAEGDEELEPEVTIINRKDATYEEYRLNGRLYMVKVKPVVGPPYYYVDRDGDGLMETRMNERTSKPTVPQWVIFSW
ncbi:MAG: DUF2782 domain-containing protein [Gammaproteobacteria bacterium]|nr:DUF2782 domain-containing protein [Gammaproteobacteria bacterium]MCP5200663.1 DUF2782 domain-containing protein [Gammaproteobacteria bacterium]